MKLILKILIAVTLFNTLICAQQNGTSVDWDLSYKTLLEQNNVAKTEWIWSWLERYKSPAEKWITGWEGKPIVSSILIEYPAFHAAEHTTIWLIRTNDESFYWESIEGSENDDNERLVSTKVFDGIFQQVSSWKQLSPKAANELSEQALPGYFGFLSYHGTNGSKQMLLTMDDFVICREKSCLPGKVKYGRLMAALEPILIPEAKKNYKHKSEAQIARMTPEQRIDEQIKEYEYHFPDFNDKQSDMIRKYSLMDGLKGSSHLIHLIESYHPKRSRDSRYSQAVMMASDIDEQVVRLRSSPEGRSIIEAIKRLSAKMTADGKKFTYAEIGLPQLEGINLTDESVRDTLWVKYRINMSDSELLKFSNYLVELDPTYPGWSKTDFIKDFSRTNEAGFPAQVYIMRKPKRYYRLYLLFKQKAKRSN